MTINFYSLSAKRNELSKTLGTATAMTGTLRDPCSLIDPDVLIESATVPAFNYAQISDFGRYYFVTSITAESYHMYRVRMHEDVLMSWKGTKNGASSTGIYGLTAYISRQEGSPFVGEVPETDFPVQGDTICVASSTVSGTAPSWEGSEYIYKDTGTKFKKYHLIIKTSGESNTSLPLSMFTFDIDANAYLSKAISDDISSWDGKTLNDFIFRYGVYPFELVSTVQLGAGVDHTLTLPGSLTGLTLAHVDGSVPLYWYRPTNASFRPISFEWTMQVDTPSTLHLERNLRPYHRLCLRFRPFGKFELDEGLIFRGVTGANTTFKVKVEADPITGNACLFYGKSSADIYLGSANILIEFPISSETYSASKMISGALQIAGSVASAIATHGATAGTIPGAAINAISSVIPNVAVTGGEQRFIDNAPVIEQYKKTSPDFPYDTMGKPFYARATIYTLTGFTKISEVFIGGTGFAGILEDERKELETILKGGIIV